MDKDAEHRGVSGFPQNHYISLHYISLSFLLLENVSEHKKWRALFRAGRAEGVKPDYYGDP